MRKKKKMVCNIATTYKQVLYTSGTIDCISKAELVKRDETIQELSTKYKKELKLRKETEQLKDQTEQHLVSRIFTCT